MHIIFHVKSADCTMKDDDLPHVYCYIGGIIRSLSGFSYAIGGRPDHIHILCSIPSTVSLSDFVRTVKANSSKWIKSLGAEYNHFSWQEGYGAFSVSESVTPQSLTISEIKKTIIDIILHTTSLCDLLRKMDFPMMSNPENDIYSQLPGCCLTFCHP